MPDAHVPTEKKSSPVTVIVILLLTVVFMVGLWVFISAKIRPRGEKIGETNLTDPLASLVVVAAPGDSLIFRTDVALGVAVLSLVDDDHLEEEASERLRKSMLTVRVTSPSNAERVVTCAVYSGRAATSSSTTGTLARTGMLNDCVIAIDAPGRWTVRGSVAWAAGVSLRSATLETRREAAVASK